MTEFIVEEDVKGTMTYRYLVEGNTREEIMEKVAEGECTELNSEFYPDADNRSNIEIVEEVDDDGTIHRIENNKKE